MLNVDSTLKMDGAFFQGQRSPSVAPGTASGNYHRSTNIKSLKEIQTFTDFTAIEEQLAAICEQELLLDKELDKEFRDSSEIRQQLEGLGELEDLIHSQVPSSLGLTAMLEKAAGLASQITKKARLVDVEQRNVQATLKLVEAVRLVNETAARAKQHMASMAHEKAAEQVDMYLKLDSSTVASIRELAAIAVKRRLSSSADPADNIKPDAASLSASLEILQQSQDKLLHVFLDEFDQAIASSNETRIVDLFKLFPMIGCKSEGLRKYGEYTSGIIADNLKTAMRQPTADNPLYFADLLLGMFDTVAQMVDQLLPFVESYYGRGQMLYLLRSFQVAADAHSGTIFDTFISKRELEDIAKQASQVLKRDFRVGSSAAKPQLTERKADGTPHALEPGELDMLLNEWGLMSQRSRFYLRFMNFRGTDEVEKRKPSVEADTSGEYGADGLMKSSTLRDKLRETQTFYLLLENFFVRISVERALKVESFTESTLTTTSMEDAFFIFSKSISRACGTRSSSAVVAIVRHVAKLLETEFLEYLQQQLVAIFSYKTAQHWFGKQFSLNTLSKLEAATSTKTVAELYGTDALTQGQILLNNLQVSSRYISKLVLQIESLAVEVFDAEDDGAAVALALKEFNRSSEKSKSLQRIWLDTFANQIMKPAVKFIVGDILSKAQYNISAVPTATSSELVAGMLERFLDCVTFALTRENYDAFVKRLAEYTCVEYEQQIFSGAPGFRFTAFGGKLLQQEVAVLLAKLRSLCPENFVNDKGNHLQQVSAVLAYDSIGSLKENIALIKLPFQDIQRVCRLRVDWKPEEVQKMLS